MEEKLNSQIRTGTSRAVKTHRVVVGVSEADIHRAAEVATAAIMQKYGIGIGQENRAKIVAFNEVSLKAALIKAIDGESNLPKFMRIPAYFDEMIRGLRTSIGRTVVYTKDTDLKVTIPDGYQEALILLAGVGVPLVRVHRPSIEESKTLALGIEDVDGVKCVVGNLKDIELSDMIRRALLKVDEETENMLRLLTGEMSLEYGAVDELLMEYFSATANSALG